MRRSPGPVREAASSDIRTTDRGRHRNPAVSSVLKRYHDRVAHLGRGVAVQDENQHPTLRRAGEDVLTDVTLALDLIRRRVEDWRHTTMWLAIGPALAILALALGSIAVAVRRFFPPRRPPEENGLSIPAAKIRARGHRRQSSRHHRGAKHGRSWNDLCDMSAVPVADRFDGNVTGH